MNKNFRNSRKAIAPAIAVALLLAITIALVAAVGYAASNVTPSGKTASNQGVFEVEISKTGGGMGMGELRIRQYSGDAIDTQNLKLKFVAKGVATEVVPTGNNTFYMAWNLYNPPGNQNGTYYQGSQLKANPEGDEEFPEYNETSANPTTFVGVHIANMVGGGWLGDISEVKLLNATSGTWVTLTKGTPVAYTDPWSGKTLPYELFSIANPDNTNFTMVQIKNAFGVASEYDLTDSELHYGDLNAGDAIFARMFEYNSPYRYSVAYLPTDDGNVHFGSYAFVAGDTIKAHGTGGHGVDAIHACISNWDYVISGDIVEVYVINSENNQVIWQGDVIVG
jgi:FlaG/FlaF family flagellin (archaellin)